MDHTWIYLRGQIHPVGPSQPCSASLQQPHPPIFIAATRTQETLEFAVSTGHPTIVENVQYTDEALDLCRRFTEMSKQSGHNVPMSSIPFSGTCTWPKLKSRLARTLRVP